MKHLFLYILILLPTILSGKDVIIKKPTCLFRNNSDLKIKEVVLSDTATILSFCISGTANTKIKIASTIVLSDEKANKYPIKKTGIDLDRTLMPIKNGKGEFNLIFNPLPKNTSIFDLIDRTNESIFTILGIQDRKKKIKFSTRLSKTNITEKIDKNFQKGPTILYGNINNYTRNFGYGTIKLTYEEFNLGIKRHSSHIFIQPDGFFNTEILLHHPVFAELNIGDSHPSIPVYLIPGDTLNINIAGLDENRLDFSYTNKDSLKYPINFLRIVPPIIYSDWENEHENYYKIKDNDFGIQVNQTLERNKVLCDYIAWKYMLTPWEVELMKNRYTAGVISNQLILANNILREKLESPRTYSENDHIESIPDCHLYIYKILNKIPNENLTLLSLPEFLNLAQLLSTTFITKNAYNKAFFKYSPDKPIEYWLENLIIADFQRVLNVQKTPMIVQTYIVDQLCQLAESISSKEKDEIINKTKPSINNIYLKEQLKKIQSLNENSSYKENEKSLISTTIEPILKGYTNKLVHIVCLSSPKTDEKFLSSSSIENILIDYKQNKDINIIFIFNSNNYSKQICTEYANKYLKDYSYILLDSESYFHLQAEFDFNKSAEQITFINKKREKHISLNLLNETNFRQQVRHILQKLK